MKKTTTTKTTSLLFAALSLAAVPVLFTACSQEESVADGQGTPLAYGEYPLVITAGGMSAVAVPVTRSTVDGDWNGADGEPVAVLISKTGETTLPQPLKYSVNANRTDYKTATLEGTEGNTYYWQSTSEVIFVHAWYPYSAEWPSSESITVKADQSEEGNYEASDVIAASKTMKFADAESQSLQFSHLMAKIAVNLTSGTGMTDNDLSGATVTLLGLAGVVDDYGNEQNSVICKQPTTAGEGSTSTTTTTGHLALVRPQVIAANTNFIQVNIGGSCYVAKFTDIQTFDANTAYTYNITVSKTGLEIAGSTIGEWEENSDDPITGTATEVLQVNLSDLTENKTVSGTAILSGSTSYKITLAAGADVTLSGITITDNYMECEGNATIRIAAGTTNKITTASGTMSSTNPYPGILLGGEGTTVEITGDNTGTLEITADGAASGIGSAYNDATTRGDILISGGTITANGIYAGIGSGANSTMGDITITGGKVTATGGNNNNVGGGSGISPGIGASEGGTCGNIKISGGEVSAKSLNWGAGIGTSKSDSNTSCTCGTITIDGGTVTATKDSSDSYVLHDIGQGFSDTVCGTVTISGDAVVIATSIKDN